MSRDLRELESRIVKPRKLDSPPLERWNPPLSGDIDIQIARDGRWFHEGTEIRRAPLVSLFASILRREEDAPTPSAFPLPSPF